MAETADPFKIGRRGRWLVRFPRAFPLGIFALVMAITLLSVFAIERLENQNRIARQNESAAALGGALERRATSVASFLRAGAAFVSAQDELSAEEFRLFVEELRLDAEYRGADGIGWAPIVERGDVPQFESKTRAELGREFQITPAPAADAAFVAPVTFLHPDTARNRRAAGFDMYSEKHRRDAMIAAARTAQPVASGPVVLKQEGEETAPGFLIYMPVFEEGGSGDPAGYIYSPFNADDFLQSALELQPSGQYVLGLFDPSDPDTPLASVGAPGKQADMLVSRRVMVAERPFVLRLTAPGARALSPLSLVTLLFGLLVASLLTFVARLLTQQAYEDESAIAWFEQQNSIRNSLTRELNHRVKNTLANVLSIIALTRRRSADLDSFADGLTGRIRALSATHDLLTQSDWATTPICSVIDAEIAPYALDSESHNIVVEGPDVGLAPNDALSLGLAIHELATNAAKYGALSVPGGTVEVRWRRLQDNLAQIDWRETGGPPVTADPKRGFGLDLIEKIVAHELGNPVDLRFDENGVRCTLIVPVRRPAEFKPRAG